jgi:fumarate reductase subunit D
METGRAAPSEGYGDASVAGAALATVFFPIFSLIVALLLLGGQIDPRKRSQLRTWAWVSGGWLLFGVVLVLLLAGVIAGHATGGLQPAPGP